MAASGSKDSPARTHKKTDLGKILLNSSKCPKKIVKKSGNLVSL